MPSLFDEWTLKDVKFRNRLGIPPMCQYSANDGFANDWHLTHLGSRAAGGFGLVIFEATAVEPRGRISPEDLGLWLDDHIEPLGRICRFVEEQRCIPAIQIAHAGRKACTRSPFRGKGPIMPEEGGWKIIGPSDLPFSPEHQSPQPMDKPMIEEVQNAFMNAAARALEAGFGIVEIHSAHGYLSHSFLSPISNNRQDEYGGSFENRTRFLRETVERVRRVWPESKPLFVRISCTDWMEGGWTLEDSVRLAATLRDEGVDLIDCSSGGVHPDAKTPLSAGYQVPFAQAVKEQAGIPTAAVGLIRDFSLADEIVRNGQADLVLLGRESLRSPYWPLQAARSLKGDLEALVPKQYRRAFLEGA